MVLPTILCIAVVVLWVVQIPELLYLRKLRRIGIRTQATINRSDSRSARGAGAWLTFTYEVNRTVYEVFQEISAAHHDQLAERSHVTVAYLPGKENAARLADQDEDWTGFNKNLRLTIVLVCAAGLFFLTALSGQPLV
ncbi:MAG: hypothetical protein IT324_05465 [Anaerolineae bacterium]|nr:hypothetical protein [Anaerolineae bacterium]